MSRTDQAIKRLFDMVFALLGIALCWPLIALCWMVAALETRSNGFFCQERIGRHGKPFRVIKIKTMHPQPGRTAVTAMHRQAITRSGAWLRRCKLDELPQLFNVLIGQMSFVGPRPDVPGYADRLNGPERRILTLRPGVTGPASLKYRDEEALLADVSDPVAYNDELIWPDKVRINLAYLQEYSLRGDLRYLWLTLFRRRPHSPLADGPCPPSDPPVGQGADDPGVGPGGMPAPRDTRTAAETGVRAPLSGLARHAHHSQHSQHSRRSSSDPHP